MSEENNNALSNNETIDNTEIEKENNIYNAEINEPKHQDVSKVKIRTILKQRFKNSSPFLKKAIPLLLVGIICFGAGLVAGREIDRHSNSRVIMNRKGMFRQMPNGNFYGGNFNKRQFNNNKSNSSNNGNNNNQKNAAPPAANTQP